jgi:hypothetical protein
MKLTLLLILLVPILLFGQNNKPTILILPSYEWCIKNGYTYENLRNAEIVESIDYIKIFEENIELVKIIESLENNFKERGFNVLNPDIKELNKNELNDKIKNQKHSVDYLTFINYNIVNDSIELTLRMYERYWNESIANSKIQFPQYKDYKMESKYSELIAKATDELNSKIFDYLESIKNNGKDIKIVIKRKNDISRNFSNQINEQRIIELLNEYVKKNSLNYEILESNEIEIHFRIAIPHFKHKGGKEKLNSPESFAEGMEKYFNKAPFKLGLECKTTTKYDAILEF